METRKSSCTVGRNANWGIHFGKHYGDFPKKLKIELPYYPIIPILDPKEKKALTFDICTTYYPPALVQYSSPYDGQDAEII